MGAMAIPGLFFILFKYFNRIKTTGFELGLSDHHLYLHFKGQCKIPLFKWSYLCGRNGPEIVTKSVEQQLKN